MMVGLTPQLEKFYSLLKRHSADNVVALSRQEMADMMGMRSKSNVHRMIECLQERGYIRRIPHKARALQVLDIEKRPKSCPKCGHRFSSADCSPIRPTDESTGSASASKFDRAAGGNHISNGAG